MPDYDDAADADDADYYYEDADYYDDDADYDDDDADDDEWCWCCRWVRDTLYLTAAAEKPPCPAAPPLIRWNFHLVQNLIKFKTLAHLHPLDQVELLFGFK